MRNMGWKLVLGLCLLVSLCDASQAAPRRTIYIVAGPDGGHAPAGHAFYTSSVLWTNRLVQKHHNLDVTLLQGWPSNPSIFTNADAIMVYSDGGCDNEGNIASELTSRDHWATAMQVINRGVSVGMAHYIVEPPGPYAMWPQQGWPTEQYGTNEFVKWMGGYYVGRYVTNLPTSDNSSFIPNLTFPDNPANPAPKITYSGFDDEWYTGLYFPKAVMPLLTANNAPARGGTQVLSWTYNRDDSARAFGFTGGHWTYGSWSGGAAQTNNLDLVLNAIEWLGRVNEDDHQQVVLRSCATWKYDVDGTMDSGWNQAGFNDSSWNSGAAPLGYDDWGQDWIATPMSAGSSNNRPITTWFRKSFYVPTLANVTNLLVKINADDGAVVYLNGTEIGRYNMPTGTVIQSTPALDAAEVNWNLTFLSKPPYTQADWDAANGDQRWVWINQYNARNAAITNSSSPEFDWGRILNMGALVPGTNVLAVEVHQKDTSNPDMRLDVEAVVLGNNLYSPTNGPVDPYLGINNGAGVSNLESSSATFCGTLTATNASQNYVWVYWGTVDGGTNKAAWQNSRSFGLRVPGPLATNITGLLGEATYYYRYYASNVLSQTWASPSMDFITPMDLSAYAYKAKITFNGYYQNATLTNFPALITFGTNITNFSYSQLQSTNGFDIRFANASQTELLSHEIEQWNPAGNSHVWVRLPTLAGASDHIWAYWGNSAVAGQAPASQTNGSTWDTNFVAVWHLNESAGGNADSTVNHLNCTWTGTQMRTNGIAGSSQYFNYNSFARAAYNSKFNPADKKITLETWVQSATSETHNQYQRIVDHDWSAGYCITLSGSSPSWVFRFDSAIGNDGSRGPVVDGNWHYGVLTYDGSIIDGYCDAQSDVHTAVSATMNSTTPFTIGADSGGSQKWNGRIDEVRISKTNRSATWLWATRMTMASNAVFTGYGAATGGIPPTVVTNTPANAPIAGWAAYNDMYLQSGESSTNISSYSGLPLGAGGGTLVDFTTGTGLTARVDLTISGGGTLGQLGLDQSITAGSDVLNTFSGKLVPEGYFYWGNGVPMTMTLSQLNPNATYKVVLFCNRGVYTDRVMRVTLSDVTAFMNVSSTGAVKSTTGMSNDTTQLPSLNGAGQVFAYSEIQPGSDGDVVLTLQAGGTYTAYLNALMVQELPSGGDTDADGMDDAWEAEYFGSSGAVHGGMLEDWDQDGLNNYGEYRAGTDPSLASSALQVMELSSAVGTNQMVLRWAGVLGRSYSILQANTLTGNWTAVQSGIPGVAPVTTWSGAVGSSMRFWRVKVE